MKTRNRAVKSIGAFEAKTHLSQLLEQVARGERFTITRHGVPVAVLGPVSAPERHAVQGVVEQIRSFQASHSLGDVALGQLIEEGRR
jgi:prevent-host-death family protein